MQTSQWLHLMAAVKEIHREMAKLHRKVDEMRQELKGLERTTYNFVIHESPHETGEEETESESESESDDSIQSAPATVSYERVEA